MRKRILAVVLLLAVLTSLAACKKKAEAKTIVGTWSAQVDVTQKVNSLLLAQTGQENLISSFTVGLELMLNSDGTYDLSLDRVHMDTQLEAVGDVMWQLAVTKTAEQTGMTPEAVEAAMAAQGTDKQQLMEQLDLPSMFENELPKSGFWKHAENMLYMSTDQESLTASEPMALQFSGDQFTVTITENAAEEGQEPTKKTVVFTRKQ